MTTERRKTLTRVVLTATAIGGLCFIGAVAPNVIQLIGHYEKAKRYSAKQRLTAYHNLKRRGFIKVITNPDNETKIYLTKKGEQRLQKLDLDELIIPKPKKWDGKWRVLMFDIPVRFRRAREAFRWKIKTLGFFQLQRSVWIYPYACIEELLFVAEFFGVTKYVEILTVEELLRKKELTRYFNLF